MQNQQGQTHMNMNTGNIPPQLNHGGHEIMDCHEVLSGTVGSLNQYTLLSKYVKDPELMDIMNRQYQFIQDEYNITVDCFRSGQEPAKPTGTYMMKQNNDSITYGLSPKQPKKPIQSEMEMSEEIVAGCLLSACKTSASAKTKAACETTNPVVRRVLADSIPNCIEMAYELSIWQNKRQAYQIPQFSQQDMQQILNWYAPSTGQPQMQNNNNMMNNSMSNNTMRH